MEKSPVVACVSQNGQAAAKLTWNIDSGMLNTGWVGIDQAPVTTVQTNLGGAGISCMVDLKKEFTISGVPINLSKKYSLIVGAGPLMGGSISMHDLKPETSKPKTFSF